MPGDKVEFVVLEDGRIVVEEGFAADPEALAAGLAGSLAAPFRAVAVRHADVWAVGGSTIEVVQLAPDPSGDDLELSWDGETLALAADGIPVDVQRAQALEKLASGRQRGAYVARARRLEGDLFEITVLPL
jgi:hypothetical protein